MDNPGNIFFMCLWLGFSAAGNLYSRSKSLKKITEKLVEERLEEVRLRREGAESVMAFAKAARAEAEEAAARRTPRDLFFYFFGHIDEIFLELISPEHIFIWFGVLAASWFLFSLLTYFRLETAADSIFQRRWVVYAMAFFALTFIIAFLVLARMVI